MTGPRPAKRLVRYILLLAAAPGWITGCTLAARLELYATVSPEVMVNVLQPPTGQNPAQTGGDNHPPSLGPYADAHPGKYDGRRRPFFPNPWPDNRFAVNTVTAAEGPRRRLWDLR